MNLTDADKNTILKTAIKYAETYLYKNEEHTKLCQVALRQGLAQAIADQTKEPVSTIDDTTDSKSEVWPLIDALALYYHGEIKRAIH